MASKPMNLSDLKPAEGSRTTSKRLGRGHGSGRVKTSGRGTKGQKARAGGGVRVGFEGGQLPIQKRLPYKRGFTNIFKTPWEVVNLGSLEALPEGSAVTPETLAEAGLIRGLEFPVKVLATGDFTRKLEVRAHAFSGAAKERIEAAGGSVVQLERTDRFVTAQPRSRKLPINRELKQAGFGKVGGIATRGQKDGVEKTDA